MKKETKIKVGIVLGAVMLYLIYLFSSIERMDFIPSMLLIGMFLALGALKAKQQKL